MKHSLFFLSAMFLLCWQATALAAPPRCTADGSTAVNFGSYLPSSTLPLSSTGTITFTCNRQKAYLITLSTGQGGSYNPRRMSGGSPPDSLNYGLYTNPGHTILWGDGTAGTQVVTGTAAQNQQVTITVYGLLPAQQNVSTGNYTDSITATITY